MNPPARAPLGAAIALLLGLGSLSGSAAPVVVLLLTLAMVAMVSVGWPDLLELPSPAGTRIVMALTGAGGALLAHVSPGALSSMEAIAAVCAMGVFGAFIHQMARRERSALTASLTGTVAGAMLTGLTACWVQAQHDVDAAGAHDGTVTAGALGLCAALLLLALPVRRALATLLAVAGAAAVTALVLIALPPHVPAAAAILAGAAIGTGTAAAHTLLGSVLIAREPVPSLAVAAAPVATAGVIVLLVARLTGPFTG